MTDSQKQQRALITGASTGIGKATALAFAKQGIDVALLARSQDKLEAVAQAARAVGVQAKAYSIDFAQLATISAKITKIVTDFGAIDILVNSAGMGYTNSLAETSLLDWQEVLNLNLTSIFQCVQAVLPGMRSQGGGIIINIASIAASNPFPGWGAYSVSKAGLIAFSQTLAVEEKTNGIRVVTISPGAVNTPLWDGDTVNVELNRQAMLTPEIVAESIVYAALQPASAVVENITLMPSAGTL